MLFGPLPCCRTICNVVQNSQWGSIGSIFSCPYDRFQVPASRTLQKTGEARWRHYVHHIIRSIVEVESLDRRANKSLLVRMLSLSLAWQMASKSELRCRAKRRPLSNVATCGSFARPVLLMTCDSEVHVLPICASCAVGAAATHPTIDFTVDNRLYRLQKYWNLLFLHLQAYHCALRKGRRIGATTVE